MTFIQCLLRVVAICGVVVGLMGAIVLGVITIEAIDENFGEVASTSVIAVLIILVITGMVYFGQ